MTVTAATAGRRREWSGAGGLGRVAEIVTAYQRLQLGIKHPLQKRHLRQCALDGLVDADQIFNIVTDGDRLLDFFALRV